MAKKILFCASTSSHIKNFHLPYIAEFKKNEYEIYIATSDKQSITDAKAHFTLPFYKNFFSLKNISAIFRARSLILKHHFDVISLHTTLAGAVVRAALLTIPKRFRPKVYYTCHGYLFSQGDGLLRWRYLLPEKLCARVTDVLMVMNREDEAAALKYRLCAGSVYYINGMGLSPGRFTVPEPCVHMEAKRALGFEPGDFLFIYAAEFSKRKNHRCLIQAFADVCELMPNTYLLLAGAGALYQESRALCEKLGIARRVRFLGHVTDMPALLMGCDACVSTSTVEGLPFNILESLASGLAVIASNIKGHRELSLAGDAFSLFDTPEQLKQKLITVAKVPNCRYFSDVKPFLLDSVLPAIMAIYINESVQTTAQDFEKVGVI